MPGATETDFLERADMLDTKIGRSKKDDPADVAKQGFNALMRGEGDVVTGWQNKLQSAIALITPSDMLAERHRRAAQPGSAAHNVIAATAASRARITVRHSRGSSR